MDEEFRDLTKLAEIQYRAEIAATYGDESAGRETGRMKRHLPGEASPEAAQKRRDKDARWTMSALEQMLLDPVYRAKYEAFGVLLSEAETKADNLIEQAEAALAAVKGEISDAIDAAPKLNGKAIFRSADGRVIDEDGNEIPPELSQGIIWPDGAMSAEEFATLLDRRKHAEIRLRGQYNFRTELGEIRNRYNDPDNPVTTNDLDGWDSDVTMQLDNFSKTDASPARNPEVGAVSISNVVKPPI